MIQVNFPIYSRKNPIIWNRICGNRVSGNHVCGNCVMLGLLSCTNFGSWCRVILKLQFITTILFSSSNTQFWEYFVCLNFEYFFEIKFLNWYQNTPKNAKVTRYVKKKKKTLCNTLNWRNWNSGFVKLSVQWAEWDKNMAKWWITILFFLIKANCHSIFPFF